MLEYLLLLAALVVAALRRHGDLVTENLNIGGIAVTLVDTAGWRETRDVVESERARAHAEGA